MPNHWGNNLNFSNKPFWGFLDFLQLYQPRFIFFAMEQFCFSLTIKRRDIKENSFCIWNGNLFYLWLSWVGIWKSWDLTQAIFDLCVCIHAFVFMPMHFCKCICLFKAGEIWDKLKLHDSLNLELDQTAWCKLYAIVVYKEMETSIITPIQNIQHNSSLCHSLVDCPLVATLASSCCPPSGLPPWCPHLNTLHSQPLLEFWCRLDFGAYISTPGIFAGKIIIIIFCVFVWNFMLRQANFSF